MAPKIKLTYFDVRARAELSRIILAQAGVEYEDCRIKGEEWQKMKPSKRFRVRHFLFMFCRCLDKIPS